MKQLLFNYLIINKATLLYLVTYKRRGKAAITCLRRAAGTGI